MTTRLSFEKSSDLACYAVLTNTYCLVTDQASELFTGALEQTLPSTVPVITSGAGQTKLTGRICVGNSSGLLVPAFVSEDDVEQIRDALPAGVAVARVNDSLSALGNCIACNDHVALIHPDMSQETESTIRSVLGVQTHRATISGNPLVGSYCRLSNQGGMVHPTCSVAELERLCQITKLPLCSGTVNRGSAVVGAGLLASDSVAFCGEASTSNEVALIDAVFKINLERSTFRAEGSQSDQLLIDSLA